MKWAVASLKCQGNIEGGICSRLALAVSQAPPICLLPAQKDIIHQYCCGQNRFSVGNLIKNVQLLIWVLGRKQRRQAFKDFGKTPFSSLFQAQFPASYFSSPLLISTPLLITAGYAQFHWWCSGLCRRLGSGYRDAFIAMPSFSLFSSTASCLLNFGMGYHGADPWGTCSGTVVPWATVHPGMLLCSRRNTACSSGPGVFSFWHLLPFLNTF